MPQAPPQSHPRHRIEIVFRKPDGAAKNRDQLLAIHLLRFFVGPVTGEAQVVRIGPEKLRTSAAVWLMTRGTAIPKRGHVKDLLRSLELSLIAMAFQACVHRIGTHQAGSSRSVRVVAVRTVSLRTRMLDLRTLDLAGSFRMASNAKRFRITFAKNHFAAYRRLMAGIAGFVCIGAMRKFLDQFRPVGLMHGVAGQAIGLFERLPTVGFDEGLAF
jgi:hypothetical protein